jgi:hypothetical protein
VYRFQEPSTKILVGERFWKTLHDGAPLHCARISQQGPKPSRAADLVVTTASQVMRSAQRDMRRPLSGGGFRAVTGRGPTDLSGTAYFRTPPIAYLNSYFAQTKEDPAILTLKGPIARPAKDLYPSTKLIFDL